LFEVLLSMQCGREEGVTTRDEFGLTNLVVGCPESSANILVVKNLYLKCEELFEVLDNHNKEGQFYAQGLVRS
jgi:hypothetical protein